jgi:hypothetical protein
MRPRVPTVVAGGILATLLVAGPAGARVEMTQDEALRLAFPPPQEIERHTLYLDESQARQAGEASGVSIEARVVPYYVGRAGGRITGFAYFDTHLVRTLPETVMIRLTPTGSIVAIDILSFDEPQDYRVTARWLEQFRGRDAAAAPRLPSTIRSLSGATLSARAVTDAARRILALHRLFVQPQHHGQESAP